MSKEDTKTKLLDAAEQQVRQKGADGFSYSDLSTIVGIRKASIHYHFPTKADLLSAVMARYSSQFEAELARCAAQFPSANDQLIDFVSLYRRALQDAGSLCLCVAFTVGRDSLSAATQAEITRFRDAVQGWLQQRFEQLQSNNASPWTIPPKAEAAATLALVEGAQLAARSTADLNRYDAATQGLLHRLGRAEKGPDRDEA